MNIVDSILAQSQAGSANGQGFGEWFARGQQMAGQRRQLDQSQQRLELERLQQQAQQSLLPARLALDQQKVQMGRLQIDQTLLDRQNEIDNTAAFGELAGTVGTLLQDGQHQAALGSTLEAISKRPALAKDPRVAGLLKDVQTSAAMGKLASQVDTANRRADILQQQADTHAADVASRVDTREQGLDLRTREAARKEGADGERMRHNKVNEARDAVEQKRKWSVLGRFANHLEERNVGNAVAAEIKLITEDTDPATTFATKHKRIQGVLERAKREHPEAFTPKDRAVLADLLQDAAPGGQPAAAGPEATHRFDPATGAVTPIER